MGRALVSTAGVADALDVSEAVIRRWHAAGRIPGYRCGRLLKFDLDEVLAALRSPESTRSSSSGNGAHAALEPNLEALDG
jgi:excisionase family DNA binding protein